MVVPSSALLDPWTDSYSRESRKVIEEQEEREPNQMQRRQGLWDPNLEPQDDSEDWGRAAEGRTSESRRNNNRHRRRRRRRRLKRSPVHHHYGGRGVHRGSHPDRYATRYIAVRLKVFGQKIPMKRSTVLSCNMSIVLTFRSRQPTGYSVASPPVPTSSVPSSRTRMRQQTPSAGTR